MKTLLLCILNGLLLVPTGHARAWQLSDGDLWSLDGGVFYPASEQHRLQSIKHGWLLIKRASGAVEAHQLGDENQVTSQDPILLVDRLGPPIDVKWHGAIEHPDHWVIGPKSQVVVSVLEGQLTGMELDQQAFELAGQTHHHKFQSPITTLRFTAADAFGNVSTWQSDLMSDFAAPELSWVLLPPALQQNLVWFAGPKATVQLSVDDDHGIESMSLNGQNLPSFSGEYPVTVNSELLVSDALGNQLATTIAWQTDDTAPQVLMTVNGEPVPHEKRMTVQVNDLIDIHLEDAGVGLKAQTYQGKTRKWRPLPKKFRFTSKGHYRIKVKGHDAVGNVTEQTIRFKVSK